MPRIQDTIFRTQFTASCSDGALVQFPELPRDMDYCAIQVRVVGTMVVTNDFDAVLADAPLQLIPSVQLAVGGAKNINATDAQSLYDLNRYQNSGNAPQLTAPGTTVASHPFVIEFSIDQSMVDGVNPKDTQLITSNLTQFALTLQFGSSANCFVTPGSGAATFTGTVTVTLIQAREFLDESGKRYIPQGVLYRTLITQDFTASNANYQQLLLTDLSHRLLMLRTSNAASGANQNASNSVLNRVTLKRGATELVSITGAAIQGEMRRAMGTVPTGLYIIDPARAFGQALAKLSDAYNMIAPAGSVAEQLYLYIDETTSSGTSRIAITQMYIEPYSRFVGR